VRGSEIAKGAGGDWTSDQPEAYLISRKEIETGESKKWKE